jgi:hypothetical protein
VSPTGGALLFLFAALTGVLVGQCAFHGSASAAATRWMLAACGTFGVVIASFLLCGFADLAGAGPVVNTAHAAAVAAGLLVAAALWASRCGVGAGAAFRSTWRDLAGMGREVAAAQPRWLVLATVGVWALLMVSTFVIGSPRGSEASAYHLFNGVSSLQAESLRLHDRMFLSANPANVGLWYGTLLSFLPERFTAMAQLPFLPVLGLAVYRIARQLGADRRAAVFAAVGMLTMPVVTLHADQAESDVIGMTLLAVALHLVLASELPLRRFVAAGLAIGLAFGVKMLYLVGGGLIFFAALLLPAQARPGRPPAAGRWQGALLLFASAVAIGSFWLLRNFLATGNPLYPIYVRGVFDALGWPGAPDADYAASLRTQFQWVRSVAEWPVYPWTEWHFASAGTHYKGNAGLGSFFAAAVPVACAVALATALRDALRRQWGDRSRQRAVMLAAGTAMVVIWFLLGDRQPRYASAAWIFLLPLVGTMLSALDGGVRRLAEGVLGVAAAWMLLSIASLELVEFGDRVLYSRQFSRAQYYEYVAEVDRLPRGARVLNLESRTSNFPLTGARHENRVVAYVLSVRKFGIEAKQTGWDISLDRDTKGLRLTAPELKALGVTHVWMRPTDTTSHDGCVRLRELGRLDRNPVSKAPIAPPKVLYEVAFCEALR